MSEADYLAHLLTGAITRARCWRLTRADGVAFGFTDHDRPLTFDGTTFEPGTALSASEASASLGMAVDEQEGSGALSSAALTEEDIDRGLYDGAQVEVFDVNWKCARGRRSWRRNRAGGSWRPVTRGSAMRVAA